VSPRISIQERGLVRIAGVMAGLVAHTRIHMYRPGFN